jgi:hypothetical protein
MGRPCSRVLPQPSRNAAGASEFFSVRAARRPAISFLCAAVRARRPALPIVSFPLPLTRRRARGAGRCPPRLQRSPAQAYGVAKRSPARLVLDSICPMSVVRSRACMNGLPNLRCLSVGFVCALKTQDYPIVAPCAYASGLAAKSPQFLGAQVIVYMGTMSAHNNDCAYPGVKDRYRCNSVNRL